MLLTISEVAGRLGVPAHRIEYVVGSRSIAPTRRAGKYRLWDEQAVERIAAALRECDVRTNPVRPESLVTCPAG